MIFSALVELFLEFLKIFQSSTIIGFISFTMISIMLVSCALVTLQNRHQNQCLSTVFKTFKSRNFEQVPLQKGELININSIFNMYDYPALHAIWREYYSAIPINGEHSEIVSPVDAGLIFTAESLNLSVRKWDRVSSLFISIGLVLTFMGLVAALQQSGNAILTAGDDTTDLKGALSTLLVVVSSKFILSITGLVCSITLNIAAEARARKNARDLAEFTALLNRAIRYIPVETLLMDMRVSLQKIVAREDVS